MQNLNIFCKANYKALMRHSTIGMPIIVRYKENFLEQIIQMKLLFWLKVFECPCKTRFKKGLKNQNCKVAQFKVVGIRNWEEEKKLCGGLPSLVYTQQTRYSSLLPLTEPPIPSPSITYIVYKLNYIVDPDAAMLTVV